MVHSLQILIPLGAISSSDSLVNRLSVTRSYLGSHVGEQEGLVAVLLTLPVVAGRGEMTPVESAVLVVGVLRGSPSFIRVCRTGASISIEGPRNTQTLPWDRYEFMDMVRQQHMAHTITYSRRAADMKTWSLARVTPISAIPLNAQHVISEYVIEWPCSQFLTA